ncbi:MAG: cytochrome c oxidase assembly protein, partial [Actinomycetota bacterium]|nr:cytochrome c oxidase assembly protein [Actinomycetota bacterium]
MTGWWASAAVGGLLALGYLGAVLARPATLPRWNPWRTAAWLAGAATVAVALSPPLMELARVDHRAHMTQHLLLGMYAPLGLVLAAPVSLALGTAPRRLQLALTGVLRSTVVHVVAHPVAAAILSTGTLFVLYLTPLFEATQRLPAAHGLLLVHLVVGGCLYTWSIAGPDPAPRRPGMTSRIVVLVGAAGAHAYLAKVLYARAELHSSYGAHGAAEAQGAAQLMYYGGDLAEILLAMTLFAAWYQRRA